MKVLDLQCANRHVFEGWFGSEADYVDQCARGLVECPACGNAEIEKRLSAPRLMLSSGAPSSREAPLPDVAVASPGPDGKELTMAWMELARRMVANTTDVGTQFAEEARRMHYGEAQERGIRGRTTPEEARSLLEEGINVMPLVLPEALKETLQ